MKKVKTFLIRRQNLKKAISKKIGKPFLKLNKLRRTKVKSQESLNNYHHSMECNFIVKTIFNDKNKHFSREKQKLQKKSKISKF